MMKRYNAYVEDYGIRFKAEVEEHSEGQYVDAAIAQDLYDALENILNDTSLDIEAIDKIQAQEALSNADKD